MNLWPGIIILAVLVLLQMLCDDGSDCHEYGVVWDRYDK